MANKQTLPGTVDTQRGFINTQGSPTMPTIDWKSPLRNVAGVVEQTADFTKTYANMKYDQFQAELQNMEFQQLHEMEDATDPCQLEEINQRYNESYNNQFKDSYWGKSYYNSEYYKKWQNDHKINQERMYLRKQHEFEEIQAEATLNEISNTIALMDNPQDVYQALRNGEGVLASIKHMSADRKFERMSNFYKNSVEKLYSSNPNKAVAWLDYAGNRYDKFGLNGGEVRKKAEKYNLAMLKEKRQEALYQERRAEKVRNSIVAAAKVQIIQDPSKAEAVIANMPDNESYVDVSDWYRKGLGKDTSKTKSALSQNLVDYVKENGIGSVRNWMDDNPEYINDTDARAAVNQALSQTKEENTDAGKEVKAELAKLDTKKKFEEYMSVPENRTKAVVYANETVKNLNKQYGIDAPDDYVERYIADLNSNKNEFSEDDIKAERVKVKNNPLLSAADKNKVYKTLDSFQTSAGKAVEKERKELSAQALNEVRLVENGGSADIERAIVENIKDLSTSDMGQALGLRNAALRREGKESQAALKEADKQMQESLYTTLLRDVNENGYNDTDAISQMQEKGLLNATQAGKLLKSIYDKQDKTAVQAEKDLVKNAYLQIYEAEANNELPPTISELKTDNPQVIKERARVANKVAKNRYIAEKNRITEEIFKNPPMTREDVDDYVERLSSLNYIGNDKSPEQQIQEIITKAQNIPEGNRKYITDKLYSYMPKPLNGKQYSNYELNLRNQALDEVLQTLANEKEPDFEVIANKYKPTLEGYQNDVFDKDNAYYSMLGEKNNIFETLTVKDEETGTSSSTYLVKKSIPALTYINYENTIKSNRKKGYYSDQEFKELYKPVAVNKSYIYNNLAESTETLEGRVAYKLKGLYGGRYINDIDSFANDFWNCLSFVEQQVGKQRAEKYSSWDNTGSGNVGQYVKQWFANQYGQASGTIAE